MQLSEGNCAIDTGIFTYRELSYSDIKLKINILKEKFTVESQRSCTSLPIFFLSKSRSRFNKIDELSRTVSNLSAGIVIIAQACLSTNFDSAMISHGIFWFKLKEYILLETIHKTHTKRLVDILDIYLLDQIIKKPHKSDKRQNHY